MQVLADTWLIFKHNLMLTLRNPVYVIVGLFQPICQLALFAPLLEGASQAFNLPPGGAYTLYTPGLLVMLGITGALFVGFGFIADMRAGILERMQVTQVSRLALVMGRSLCDVVMFVAQATALLLMAWSFGLQASPSGVAVAMGLLVLLSLFTSTCSYAAAFSIRDENTFSSILNFLMMPVLLLSGITLPLAFAPSWIRTLAFFNPFSHAVDATRALFVGNFTDPSIMVSFVVITILTLLSLNWAVRAFRQGMA